MHVIFLGLSIVFLIVNIIDFIRIVLFESLLVKDALIYYGLYSILIGLWGSLFIKSLKKIIKEG